MPSLPVVSTRLTGGRMELRVVAEDAPGAGFEPVDATLEDVYFAALKQHGLGEDLD